MRSGGILSTLYSIVMLFSALVLLVVNFVPFPGALGDLAIGVKDTASIYLSFAPFNETSLLVPIFFMIFQALFVLAIRRKHPYTAIFAIYLFLIYFTFVVDNHLTHGITEPSFIMSHISPNRAGLIKILIVLESLLAFVILYITGSLNAHYRALLEEARRMNDDVAVATSSSGFKSRKKLKKIQERERKREEKKEKKEAEKEARKQAKLQAEMDRDAERAERETQREIEREEKREAKKEEKKRKKEAKLLAKRAIEEEHGTGDEDNFSTTELESDFRLPDPALSMDRPLEFPTFKDIPRLSTIEHSEHLDKVSPDPRIRFKNEMGLAAKESSFASDEYREESFQTSFEEKDDDPVFEEEERKERYPKYSPSQAGTHFKKGGILEATIESMNTYASSGTVKRPTSPILGLEEKKDDSLNFKKREENFAPSNLPKDHPRYKLFESLRESPKSQSVNVSHMPSKAFEAEDNGAINTPYSSTYRTENDQRQKLYDRMEEKKRESISSDNPYLSQAPSDREAEDLKAKLDKINSRSFEKEIKEPLKPEVKAEEEAAKKSSPVRAEDVESIDQKNKGKYDEGEDVNTEQTNEIFYSLGIAGLKSQDEGMTGVKRRARMGYNPPTMDILIDYPSADREIDEYTIKRGELILSTLHDFKVDVTLDNIVKGPTVTMYELKLAEGVPVSKIKTRYDDLQYALGVRSIRILAPVPGKQAVGIEVPNSKRATIGFKDMLYTFNANSENKKMAVPMILGRTITGEPISINVAKAPHLLIAGSTGSGKSVGINSLIATILYNKSPRDVRLIMVDPKVVELKIYNGIPHLLTPVITDAKRVQKVLAWLTDEMDRRYEMISRFNVRNIEAFNEKLKRDRLAAEKLPYIVLIMDEYADLMSTIGKDIEYYVGRLAAMARAVGIHIVLATQRPSAEVVTGTIKNNIPTRIAFAVASGVNSKIILDEMGAESLLGKGDMLYKTPSSIETIRIQGAFLSDGEVEEIVEQVKANGEADYLDESIFEDHDEKDDDYGSDDDFDYIDSEEEEYERAKQIVYEKKSASASYLQRRMKIGYNKAARYVERMEEDGIVGPPNGSKPRELIKMV